MSNAWIQTFRGLDFDFTDLDSTKVHIVDIAHSQSLQCRFTGHVKRHYSIAEHSVLVSKIAGRLARERGRDPMTVKLIEQQGLMHDATEAYVVDLASPIKKMPALFGYNQLEADVWTIICVAQGIVREMYPEVKEADMIMLATEKAQLLGRSPRPWMPMPVALPKRMVGRLGHFFHWRAKYKFLRRFNELFDRKPETLKERILVALCRW